MKNIKIIAVDLQYDFTREGGFGYVKRSSIDFIKKSLIPFLKEKDIKVAEIISDYRQPRPGDRGDCCHPGEWGYKSEIPDDIKNKNIWIKSMNSPIWIRENIGDSNKEAGLPYQDPKSFGKWLDLVIGKPDEVDTIVLFGLTIDCCVLSIAQELSWRAYKVRILTEGVDAYSGSLKEREYILNNAPLDNWAKPISWEEFKNIIG